MVAPSLVTVISPSGEIKILSRPKSKENTRKLLETKEMVAQAKRLEQKRHPFIVSFDRAQEEHEASHIPRGPSEVLMMLATVLAARMCDYHFTEKQRGNKRMGSASWLITLYNRLI